MNSLANYHSPDDPFYYPKKKKRAHPERDIQNSIIQILNLKGHFCWKTVNRGFQMPGSGAWISSSVIGIPDIFVLLKVNGISAMIGLEVKTATGRQSEAQKQWQQSLERNNGFYFLVRSVEESLSSIDYAYNKTMQILQRGVQDKAITGK